MINIKKKCVVCGNMTYQRLEHKTTKEQYPFCLECYRKNLYNDELFLFRNQRSKWE